MTTADRFAAKVVPVIRDFERAGVITLQGIADALNAGHTDGAWSPVVRDDGA